MNKSELRKIYLAKRKEIPYKDVKDKSEIIKTKILNSNWYKNSDAIMIYVSFNNEVETKNIIEDALNSGKNVVVPVCIDGNNLIPAVIQSICDMIPNKYGILEPKNIQAYTGNIDTVIVPGIAFDTDFNRVGFGCGYYDRFLQTHPEALKIGICFNDQICDKIDTDIYDISMDIIITEEEILIKND